MATPNQREGLLALETREAEFFDISSLLTRQNHDVDVEPQYVSAGDMRIPRTEVRNDGMLLTVSFLDALEGYIGRRNMIDDELKKIRHDTVANLLGPETDVSFRVADPNYDPEDEQPWHKLTPDCWDPDARVFLELGTSRSDSVEGLQRTYVAKSEKYANAAARSQVNRMYYLIVSTHGVYTNLSLDQIIVDNLACRMKIGLSLEIKITNLLARDIFTDDQTTMRGQIIRDVLSQIQFDPEQDEADQFPKWMMNVSQEKQSDEANDRVADIIQKCMMKVRKTQKGDVEEITRYHRTHIGGGSRSDLKRITVWPFIMMPRLAIEKDMSVLPEPSFVGRRVPTYISSIWTAGYKKFQSTVRKISLTDSIAQSYVKDLPRHVWKSHQKFKVELTREERIDASLSGLWKKEVEEKYGSERLSEKIKETHKSFSLNSKTDDIKRFIEGDSLTDYKKGFFHHDEYMPLIRKAKSFSQQKDNRGNLPDSETIWNSYIASSELISFADFISCVVEEVSLAMKHYCSTEELLIKQMKYYDCLIIIVPTGTHCFVSCMFYKYGSKIIDTGRLGTPLHDIGDYYVSEFFSLNEVTMEHFCKSGPYIAAIMVDMLTHFSIDPTLIESKSFFSPVFHPQFWQTLKTIFLCYLNTKLDLEELITGQRFLFMNLFDDICPDPIKHIERLPTVLRSRMTVYLTNRILDMMKHYSLRPIEKVVTKGHTGGEAITYMNIASLFCEGTVTLEQKISEFYFGYVISKEKGKGSMKSFSICEKLYSQEKKFMSRNGDVLSKIDEPQSHRTDIDCLTRVIDVAKDILQIKMGENYMELLEEDIIRTLGQTSFSDLATLKASARSHVEELEFSDEDLYSSTNVKTLLEKLKAKNSEEFRRRPKMLESIVLLTEQWIKVKGRSPLHVFELAPYCLETLENKDCFESDLFSKSQHGGDREIHVLEVTVRVLQLMVETISRRICNQFKSETITHPETKDTFVSNHYKAAGVSYDDFITVCKSSDATKWCQNHHSSRFAFMLLRMTKPIFHGLIFRVLRLWTKKTINLPMELIAVFLKNKSTPTGNKVFEEMREDFYHGNSPFTKPQGHKIVISSGMFQGILHFCSSLFHTILQEYDRLTTIQMIKKKIGINPVVTVTQSSDDASKIVSVPVVKARHELLEFLFVMLVWKEHFGEYLHIKTSWAKSAMLIVNLVEFNSEWFLRQKVVRPRFRWISACLETNMTDSFVTRQRIFSNVLTQAAEGGASTFECSLVQIAQAWMHYKILGLDVNPLFGVYRDKLLDFPDASLGFYPLDPDLTAGITGYDFSLYLSTKNAFKEGGYIPIDTIAEVAEMRETIEEDNTDVIEKISKEIGSKVRSQEYVEAKSDDKLLHLSSVKLMFNNLSIWQGIVNRLKLGNMESVIGRTNADPELLYGKKTGWNESKISLIMKLYSPGVKQSLSSHQPMIRMMVSSAYILNRKCLRVRGEEERYSLYHLLSKRISEKVLATKEQSEARLRVLFPFWHEYENMYNYLNEFRRNAVAYDDILSKRSKYRVKVFSSEEEDFSLVQICRRKWFYHNWLVPVGNTHFNTVWEMTKRRFTFLRETIQETAEYLNLNMIELRFFLESMAGKGRVVKLTDTTARGKDIFSVLTRIFWTGKKLRSSAEPTGQLEISTLRSNIYSVITYAYTPAFATQVIKKMITECHALSVHYSMISRENRGLKLLYDFLKGESKAILIERLKRLKNGKVGYFSIRQEYSTVLREYGGLGEWKGMIAGVPTIIAIEGREVTSVTVKSISEMGPLSWSITSLLAEFGLKFPENPLPKAGNLYLTPRGNFQVFSGIPSKCVPIAVDASMDIRILDAVGNAVWEITHTPGSVRLVFKEGANSMPYTLYSESFNSKDWVPELSYTAGCDPMHQAYYKDIAFDMKEIKTFFDIMVPIGKRSRDTRLHMFRNTKTYRMFNIPALQKVVIRACFPSFMSNDDKKQWENRITQIQSLHYDVTSAQIEEMFTILADIPLEESQVNHLKDQMGYISDEDEVNFTEDEELNSNHDESEIRDILANIPRSEQGMRRLNSFLGEMKDSGLARQELMELREDMAIGMTVHNSFLAYLSRYLELDLQDQDFLELLNNDDLKYAGLTGQVLSLLTMTDRCLDQPSGTLDVIDELEEEVNQSETNLGSGHTVVRLRESIDDLSNLINNATGENRDYLIHLRRLRQNSLDEILEYENEDIGELETKDIPKDTFLEQLAFKLIDLKAISDDVLDTVDLMSLPNYIKNDCISKLRYMRSRADVNDDKLASYKASIKSSHFSEEFADLLCETFNFNLVVYQNGEQVFRIRVVPRADEDIDKNFPKTLTLAFNMNLLTFE